MVAALLRLRFRVLANTLRRSPVLLVATLFGGVQALLVLGIVLLGMLVLAHQDTPPVMRVLVPELAGSVVLLGWIVLPLAVAGIEPTLDPRKLAPFPIPVGTLMVAMALVGLLWTAGATTLLGAAVAAGVWWRDPAALLAQLLLAPVIVLMCIAGSRAATTLAGLLVAGRGLLRRALAVVVALGVLLAPIASAVVLGLQVGGPPAPGEEDLRVPAIAAMLGRTPLGAVWSIPGHVAARDWGEAGVSLLIALGVLAVLLLLWRLSLGRALESGSGSSNRLRRQGLGPFAVLPPTPAGAIAARSLVSWVRDPRYTRQLVILPVLPVLLVILALVVRVDGFAYAAAPSVAGLLPLSQFAAVSYDGTAFGGQLAAGVRGTADRIGRTAALLVVTAPAVIAVAALSLLAVDGLDRLPAVLGVSFGALLTGLAVAAVSSALVVVAVPPIGRNPFGAIAGSNTTQVVGSYAVTLAAGALLLPVLGLAVAALLLRSPALEWLTLAAGLGWGGAALAGGIAVGGRLLDRNGPALLARLVRGNGR